VSGFCERDNEAQSCLKGGEFLEYINDLAY
jgi:hypothetical protein